MNNIEHANHRLIPPEREQEARERIKDFLAALIPILERIHADPKARDEFYTLTGLDRDPRMEDINLRRSRPSTDG
jgi:hypothetical protein